jgi:4-hydroxyacetophenone monooxygenase
LVENRLSFEQLNEALADANYPTLLMVLVHLTGDLQWLEPPYRPTRPPGLSIYDSGGFEPAIKGRIRDAAAAAIDAYLDGVPPALPHAAPDALLTMASASLGEELPPEYGELIASILDETANASAAAELKATVPVGTSAVIIGAGASGLAAAVRLGQAGVAWTILERSDDVGGTWLDNQYPGCAVDTPSHLYSYSFAPHDWTRYFAKRDELQGYFEQVTENWDLRQGVQFGVEVVRAVWDGRDGMWVVDVRRPDGSNDQLRAHLLISAVGAFGRPVLPDIPGLESFAGTVAHTAQWPEEVSLDGRRVGVIGSGASAMQVVPAAAEVASQLTVFQRTPQWASPLEPSFAGEIAPGVRRLIAEVPFYRLWLRVREAWLFNDTAHAAITRDPEWPIESGSLSAASAKLREILTRYIDAQLEGRDDLIEASVPSYPPFGKRMLMDHGWYETLRRENVELVSAGIESIDASGVQTGDGRHHALDVLVMATGFDVVHFVSSYEVVGRDGLTLSEAWDGDDAKAYLGLCVAGFPNFFTLYGPNTQAGHGGSLLFAVEAQLDFMLSLLAQTYKSGNRVVECRQEAYEKYADAVDAAHRKLVWTNSDVSTYYRNSRGRIVVNSPWRIVDYWRMAHEVQTDDFEMSALPRTSGHSEP